MWRLRCYNFLQRFQNILVIQVLVEGCVGILSLWSFYWEANSTFHSALFAGKITTGFTTAECSCGSGLYYHSIPGSQMSQKETASQMHIYYNINSCDPTLYTILNSHSLVPLNKTQQWERHLAKWLSSSRWNIL